VSLIAGAADERDDLVARESGTTTDLGKTAIVYARVSTKEQAERDGDPDGYSIPAQREACRRKAAGLDASVVAEYIDRGESARSADRTELQRMLKRLAAEPVSYVIVHKIDRLARNRSDDVAITAAIVASGATLVSVTENIDETPSGLLLHGIMSSIAEFYSRNLAAEVVKGTQQKFRAGGTVTLAPPGYLNVRKIVSGCEVRTIELDPERAPHIRWAFKAYATGDWTLNSLALELQARGLTQRPTKKRAAGRPFLANALHNILRNRYYLGFVRYRGVESDGKHEALIDAEVFEAVQRVLTNHRVAGERSYRRQHYLSGSLVCGRCRSRLGYGLSTGKTGQSYGYFFCLGRHSRRTACTLRYLPELEVEAAVEEAWSRERPALPIDKLQTNLMADFEDHAERARHDVEQLKRRADQLRRERIKWAEKAMEGVVPDDIARDKQGQLAVELARVETDIVQLRKLGDLQRESLEAALRLVADCGRAYALGSDVLRRSYNQAWFQSIAVNEDEGPVQVVEVEREEIFEALHTAQLAELRRPSADMDGVTEVVSPPPFRLSAVVASSNVALLVGMAGFEPTTSSSRTKRATKLRHIPMCGLL
jgi:site-specific DNA recombinase